MKLSPNFELEEFQKGDPIPPEAIPGLEILCQLILEPARAFAGVPFQVTSGYRSPEANLAAHGQPNSEHIYTVDQCAADFFPSGKVREVFNWMRLDPSLPYHQLILEHGKVGSVIHVSWNRFKVGLRSVLEGATHNAEPYVKVDHVAYIPPDMREITAG